MKNKNFRGKYLRRIFQSLNIHTHTHTYKHTNTYINRCTKSIDQSMVNLIFEEMI